MKGKEKIPEYDYEFEEGIESDDGESIILSTIIKIKGSCKEEDIPIIIRDFVTQQARKEADCLGQSIDDYKNFIDANTINILKEAVVDIQAGTLQFDWIEPNEPEEECVDPDVEWDEWGPYRREK